MKRVLIPVDGSECALRAVALVIGKRARYSDPAALEIHLVNVQAPFSHDISRFASHEQISGFHREESEKLLKSAEALLDAAGARFRTHCEVGHPAEVICALAARLQCDQIIMGTHGRTALLELLAGSTTLKVLHLTTIPVLLVK